MHFLALGAVLFVLARTSGWAGNDADSPFVIVTPDEIAELRRGELAGGNRQPGAEERGALIDAAIDEEILYREALARGFDANDAVVERRLIQNMRFVSGDAAAGEATLLRRARAAGLFEGDAVIRRRLIQKMRFALKREADTEPPSERQLRDYFAAHAAELSAPPRVRLTQLFFSGPHALDKADAELVELRRTGAKPEQTRGRGEPFVTGSTLSARSEPSLAKLFGPELARQSMTLPLKQWSGPVPSPYGAHILWIHERTTPATPSFDAVRGLIRERLEAERAAQGLRDGLSRLRRRYVVRVDPSIDFQP